MTKKYSIAIIFLVSLLISVLIGSYSYALNEPMDISQLTKQRSGIDSCNRVELRPTTTNLSYGRGTTWQTCGVRLVFQNDGNLVLFSPRGAVLWATGTERANANELRVQRDGNVVLYANTQPVWQTNTPGNRGAFLALQADGNLVVYASNGRPLFNTNTAGSVARETNAAAQQQQAQQQSNQWRVPWEPASLNPRITQSWHPDGYGMQALDFALNPGTAIVAPIQSTVIATCNAGLDHRAIKLRAADGQEYSMIHVRASNSQVSQGKTFRQGEQIGTVAPETAAQTRNLNSACAVTTGPHLHLGLQRRQTITMSGRTFP